MPLRIIRTTKPALKLKPKDDALPIAITTSSILKELGAISMFPPVQATVSVLLIIMQTLKSVQDNKEGCANLAHRCAQILLDLNDLMQGRWHSAPPALLKNLERYTEILYSIHKFMITQANEKWAKRLLRKASIEAALVDFDKKLSDAAQMFQIAMLVDIGHHLLPRTRNFQHTEPEAIEELDKSQTENIGDSDQLPAYTSRQGSLSGQTTEAEGQSLDNNSIAYVGDDDATLNDEENQESDAVLVSDAVLEDHGYRRYHNSEVVLTGRSKIKSGWWADTASADVGGQTSLVKYYEGSSKQGALKAWLRDVKTLQNMFHPSLPHMTGYSDEHSPTPFILLSDTRTNAPDKLIYHTLKNDGVATCLALLGKYYSDITDAATYVQRQLNLTENQVQDFVEKTDFRVNSSKTIIMGLPPNREGSWTSWRNYGLPHTLAQATMNMLPGKGTIQSRLEHYEDEKTGLMIAHLVSLAKALLSVGKSSSSPLVTRLLEDDDTDDFDNLDDKPTITMKQLRELSLQAGKHDFYWTEMSAIPPHKFSVGDYGYVPKDSQFSTFVKLGNVYADNLVNIPITSKAYGTQFCWEDRPIEYVEIEKYCLPGDVYCWPIAVPRGAQIDCQIGHSEQMNDVNEAWRALYAHAKPLADRYKIAPEDLILLTAAGKSQNFYIRDFGNQVAMMHRPPGIPNQFRSAHTFMNPHQAVMSIPTIMYLMTSPNADHQPYWSHQPMHIPDAPRPSLKHGWVQNIGLCHGFVQWIRFLTEDFVAS